MSSYYLVMKSLFYPTNGSLLSGEQANRVTIPRYLLASHEEGYNGKESDEVMLLHIVGYYSVR